MVVFFTRILVQVSTSFFKQVGHIFHLRLLPSLREVRYVVFHFSQTLRGYGQAQAACHHTNLNGYTVIELLKSSSRSLDRS